MKASPAAIILGFFAWVWIVLPFLGTEGRPGGANAVKAVLAAKFLNRTS